MTMEGNLSFAHSSMIYVTQVSTVLYIAKKMFTFYMVDLELFFDIYFGYQKQDKLEK